MQYYIGNMVFGQNDLAHAEAGGWQWKKHKYIRKEGNKYIYPEDLKTNSRGSATYTRDRRSARGPQVMRERTVTAQRAQQVSNLHAQNQQRLNTVQQRQRVSDLQSQNKQRLAAVQQKQQESLAALTSYHNYLDPDASLGYKIEGYALKMQSAVADTVADVKTKGAAVYNSGKAKVNSILDKIKGFASNIGSKVMGVAGRVKDKAVDMYKLGTGQYVKEAEAAYARNPTPDTKAAFEAAQSRYNNSIFGKVKNLIKSITARTKRAYGRAKQAAGNAAGTVKNKAGQIKNSVQRAYNRATTPYLNNSSRKKARQAERANAKFKSGLVST